MTFLTFSDETSLRRCSVRGVDPRSASEYVCWSRMQAEAGQALEAIIARKEVERRAGKGVFTWGVGNAPALIAKRLALAGIHVPAIFSIMKSKPKATDLRPSSTLVWRRYIDCNGTERALPRHALITSRGDSEGRVKRSHYALICRSEAPLMLRRGGPYFHPSAYRNAGGTGAPVGASQVTAMLKLADSRAQGASDYQVNLSAILTDSYWVKLTDPVKLPTSKVSLLMELDPDINEREWLRVVAELRSGPAVIRDTGRALLL